MKKNSLNRIKWLILALSAAVLLNVLLLLQFSPRARGLEHPGIDSDISGNSSVSVVPDVSDAPNTPDVSSVSDVLEVSDIPNVSDAPNTPNVSGVPDIPNAPDNIAGIAGSGGGPGDITAAGASQAPTVSAAPGTSQAYLSASSPESQSDGSSAVSSGSLVPSPASQSDGSSAAPSGSSATSPASSTGLLPDISPTPLVELPEDTVTLCLMGDLMCLAGQQYTAARRDGSHDYSDSFGMILEILSQCDFVIANLETTLSESNPYSTAERLVNDQPNCNAPADYLGSLRQAGITHLVTANNHSLDGGIIGVEETIAHLEEYGIPHIGTYRMDNIGKRYLLLEKNGIRIALLAFTELINQRDTVAAEQLSRIIDCYSSRTAADRIAAARADGADFVIVYNHWGSENTHEVRAYQRKHAQELADAGADLIIGSHPHCLQEQEELTASDGRRVPCFYSLGNVVSSMTRDINHDTVLVLLTLQRGDLRQEADSSAEPAESAAESAAGDSDASGDPGAAGDSDASGDSGAAGDSDASGDSGTAVSIRGLELIPCHVLQSLEGKYRVITPADYLPADKKAAAELAAAEERISTIFPQYELYVGP